MAPPVFVRQAFGGLTPRRLAWALVLAVTATLGWFIAHAPLQLSDGVSNMITVVDSSPRQLFVEKLSSTGYFRPLMWPPYLIVMDLSRGAYFAWFKTIHVAQVLALLFLFLRWLRVETATDAVAFAFGLAVLVGGHTFAGLLREAYPINHFLAIAICALGAAVLAVEPRRRLNDALALLLFVYAALTLESGLLVWVAALTAWGLGGRGVSRTALAVMTAGVVAYLFIRFGWFDTGTPDLVERDSGFGFTRLSPGEIQRRFGDQPLVFYAYNVSAALLSMLAAEPRGGVYRFVQTLVDGTRESWTELNVFCATGVSLLVGATVWLRRGTWRRGRTHHGRVLLMAPVMALANAAFCYAYVKDVVLSTAGVFIAAAAAVAMREMLLRVSRARWRSAAVAAVFALTLLSSAWTVKLVGVHFSLHAQARALRREWAFVDDWMVRNRFALDSPAKQALKRTLEADALRMTPPGPWPRLPWSTHWFDETQ
jgi:hypothetical protein